MSTTGWLRVLVCLVAIAFFFLIVAFTVFLGSLK